MKISIRICHCLLFVMTALFASRSTAFAQKSAVPQKAPSTELALQYQYVRSNAPPGGCTCFSLNGGGGSFAWQFKPGRFALVGDVSVTRAAGISSSNFDLILSTFLAGARYTPHWSLAHGKVQPFAQAMAGIAHASGSLASGQNSGVNNAGAAFAGLLGGGLDMSANPRFSLRLIEADYMPTTFDNSVNNHQNNLRLSAGVIFKF